MTLQETTQAAQCMECEDLIDMDEDYARWCADGLLCETCERSALEYASTVLLVGYGQTLKYLVTDNFAMDTECAEEANNMRREWVETAKYRGYYQTTIDGMVEVQGLTGWTTGFVDHTVEAKHDFNQWAEDVCQGEIEVPVPIAIVCDITTNVFSTAIGVHVAPEHQDQLLAWLGDQYNVLHGALS